MHRPEERELGRERVIQGGGHGRRIADLNGNISCRKSKKKAQGGKTSRWIISLCFSARGDENGKDEK